jgi:hypothetical protein
MELTGKELDDLIVYYIDATPKEANLLPPTAKVLCNRGLLQIFERDLFMHRVYRVPRYWICITSRGMEAVQEQDYLQLVLSCIRCGLTSEALQFMRWLSVSDLPVLLTCDDRQIRRQAKKFLGAQCAVNS